MEKEKIMFGVSVPTKEHKEWVDRIATANGRSRSGQITVWIEQEARKHGFIPVALDNGSAIPQK